MPGPSTTAVHAGDEPDPRTGAVTTPLTTSSTFWYPELPGGGASPYIYGRYTNPSVEAVERKLAALEGADGALLFASGMGAVQAAVAATLQAGDTMAVQSGVYGGTTAFLRDEMARFGVKVHALPTAGPCKVPAGTRLVWMESITNPALRVADVRAWADAAHAAGALLAVDATFATPLLQKPLALGADLVMHSATKYLGGHTDLIAGSLAWGHGSPLADSLKRVRRNLGAHLDPHAAYLLGRGMKTLPIRMERHCANAARLARACLEMPGIETVHYPGLATHPDHLTACEVLAGGFGGMVTLDLGSVGRAQAFRRQVRLLTPAASFGGVESLVSLPLETSHSYHPPEVRAREGVRDGMVRISVGIEDLDDLVADVRQALA
ncbi:MAG: cystathionine gamma-lyase [Thermoplasmata archaeon]|jgi:methionine-gamma-lyase|nr:cystathionine gamma-lyase [Thermoplasmata archaeon]